MLGGEPAFKVEVPVNRPTVPDMSDVGPPLERCLRSGMLTNGHEVESLERAARERLKVADVVALQSCTAGLMLIWKILGIRGTVAVPSFTFPASVHAMTWNGLTPRFMDCDRETFTVSPADVAAALSSGAKAVSPVYIFGNPPDWRGIQPLADAGGVPCVADAAHALGTGAWGRAAGAFGLAEVFSLAPTKVVTACEGGLVATNDTALGKELRIARNYGNPGDYNSRWVGVNGRMSEVHAIIARLSLDQMEENVGRRDILARAYKARLAGLPGISFQKIPAEVRTNWNYFAILVEADAFGMTSMQLKTALAAEGVASRRYFYPPVHTQRPYKDGAEGNVSLPNTDWICRRILCLPMYSHLEAGTVEGICDAIVRIQANAEAVRRAAGD